MSDEIYKKQVGGTHYKSMAIQPSEFINRNNIPFAEATQLNICVVTNRKIKKKIC